MTEQPTDGELRRQLADAIAALGKSETELAQVRALADRWVEAGPPPLGTSMSRWRDMRLAELHTALNQPGRAGQPTRTTPDNPNPATTQPAGHVYLSTGCHHGDHDYCQSMTGLNGAKRPGECKHCGAKCRCGCHRPQAARADEPARTIPNNPATSNNTKEN